MRLSDRFKRHTEERYGASVVIGSPFDEAYEHAIRRSTYDVQISLMMVSSVNHMTVLRGPSSRTKLRIIRNDVDRLREKYNRILNYISCDEIELGTDGAVRLLADEITTIKLNNMYDSDEVVDVGHDYVISTQDRYWITIGNIVAARDIPDKRIIYKTDRIELVGESKFVLYSNLCLV